ncbi:hypothetical protein GCM10023196_081320 [Actinoallomurus vinaceus]|uniref:Lipoprotein LpqB beta-propeller domain-containing protein n=1 Tax=Actinoallomurus vinaceus TaxID=1080074 RepID=A0ABP8UN45_9ACTN
MAATEPRLRDAFAEEARTARSGSARRLTLPARGRRLRWLMPVIAASAVAVSVALTALVGRTALSGPPATGRAPAFVVATTGFGRSSAGESRVEVRDPKSGRVYDTRAASRGLAFQYVAAAANRVFFVMAAPARRTACDTLWVYRMKVSGKGRITAFSALGARIQGATAGREGAPGGLAASPDGTKVAYAVRRCGGPADRTYYKLGVADTVTGAQREWTDSRESIVSSLSWTSDARQVAFLLREPVHTPADGPVLPSRNGVVRLLDIGSKRSTDLGAAKVLLRRSRELTNIWAAVINGDGTRVAVVAEYSRAGGALAVCQVSLADGRVLRMLHREGSDNEAISAVPGLGPGVALRSDTSGRHLLYHDASLASAPSDLGGYGRIDDGRFHAIPVPRGAEDTYDLAW